MRGGGRRWKAGGPRCSACPHGLTHMHLSTIGGYPRLSTCKLVHAPKGGWHRRHRAASNRNATHQNTHALPVNNSPCVWTPAAGPASTALLHLSPPRHGTASPASDIEAAPSPAGPGLPAGWPAWMPVAPSRLPLALPRLGQRYVPHVHEVVLLHAPGGILVDALHDLQARRVAAGGWRPERPAAGGAKRRRRQRVRGRMVLPRMAPPLPRLPSLRQAAVSSRPHWLPFPASCPHHAPRPLAANAVTIMPGGGWVGGWVTHPPPRGPPPPPPTHTLPLCSQPGATPDTPTAAPRESPCARQA